MQHQRIEHFYKEIDGWFNFQAIYRMAVQKYDNAVFVELGTWLGKSAAFMGVEIANSAKNIQFYCVDIWEENFEYRMYDCRNLFERFSSNVAPIEKFINPLKMSTGQAAAKFDNESVDFLYIDASHLYENVKTDLELWTPKVKKNGIIAGHDYNTCVGVEQAVDEWSTLHGYKIDLTIANNSWFVELGY